MPDSIPHLDLQDQPKGSGHSKRPRKKSTKSQRSSSGPLIVAILGLLVFCASIGGYLYYQSTLPEEPTAAAQKPDANLPVATDADLEQTANTNTSQVDPSDVASPEDDAVHTANNSSDTTDDTPNDTTGRNSATNNTPEEYDPVFDPSLLEGTQFEPIDYDNPNEQSMDTEDPETSNNHPDDVTDENTPADALPTDDTASDAGSDTLDGDDLLFDLYEKNKLLLKSSYPEIRGVYARQFAEKWSSEIDANLGPLMGSDSESAGKTGEDTVGDGDVTVRQWLESHPATRDEFYLAIDPNYDDVEGALAMFKTLYDLGPKRFERYASLAIAVSVVWDKEKGAIHGSPTGQHQSIPPTDTLDGVGNYRYFVGAESAMGARTTFLPWEFMTFMVNHRTTLDERKWALANYLPKRQMIGKCYGDVPYDGPMLAKEAPPRISGKLHILPNQKLLGGVCSCQGDYATRVAKSLGVPAFYATGENKYGGNHAWVMWVELKNITPTGFNFTLESHGRYRNDHYYIGHTVHPQQGKRETDREMERYLRCVAFDPIANRQAGLIMRAYMMICERAELGARDRLMLLDRIIKLSPGRRESWEALAALARQGEVDDSMRQPMLRAMDQLLLTFREFPDFTLEVFEDIISWEDRSHTRAEYWGRLAGMYEQAGRPDLACKARLRFAELLVDEGNQVDAIRGLASTVMKFPTEGNVTTPILNRMEQLADSLEGDTHAAAEQYLARFYTELIPKLPEKRGESVSDYYIETCRRAAKRLRDVGQEQMAQMFELKAAKLQGGD